MYFFYQKTFADKWAPRIEAVMPTAKGAENTRRSKFTSPVKLDPSHQTLSLSELIDIYPIPEDYK